jgi:tricorn protease
MYAFRLAAGTVALAALSAAWAESGAFMLSPDVHGDRVLFTREGDIWIGDLKTGSSKRLTRFEGPETKARFSPDGTQIAFQAQYDGGGTQVYVMPVDGGVPKRVTNRLTVGYIEDWTPDGKLLCRGPGPEFVWEPFIIPATGGAEQRLPIQKLGMGQIGPNGKLVFCRFADVSGGAWFRYKGGSRNDIWLGDLQSNSFKKIFESQNQAQYPQWVGERVYFVYEADGKWTVNSVDGNGGNPKRHTTPSSEVIYDLQSDGKKVIYVRGNSAEMFDPATGQTTPLNLTLNSDRIHMRPIRVDAPTNNYSITPTGKRLFVESRGQIVSVPVKEGEVRLWKSVPGARLRYPTMSPDGKKVAYVSDESREQQVYVADADGSNSKAITKDGGRQINQLMWSPTNDWLAIGDSEMRIRLVKADGTEDREISRGQQSTTAAPHNFSPDGKWLIYQEVKPWTNQIVNVISVYNIANATKHPVTAGRFRDELPTFSTDGKYIAYVSYRDVNMNSDNLFSQLNSEPSATISLVPVSKLTPSPLRVKNDEEGAAAADAKPSESKDVVIDFENIETRIITIPGVSGEISGLAVVGDRVVYSRSGQIGFYDLNSKSGGTITPGFGFEVSADGKNLLLGGMRVVPVSGKDLPANSGQVSMQGFKLVVDPAKEWEQIFWDAWRLCRDYFYVRNMHGLDWNAVGRKYAAMLPQVRARNELTELIRWMQAELSVGHSFRSEPTIFNGGVQANPGYLGIETVTEGGKYKISRIYDGDGYTNPSPMLEPGLGVGVGTYILAVNGKSVSAAEDYREELRDRVGQVVSLLVNDKPGNEGARTIYVKPISGNAERSLLEKDAAKKRREYVDQKSGGKVGYIYLGGFSDPNMEEFALQYFGQRDKEALIFDIRENNGGYISAVIVSILNKETYLRRSMRNSTEASTRYYDAFEGYLSLLVNEDSYSDGEGGPANWHYAKLGPIIGTRTYGALVGSAPSWQLVDGGGIQVPRYGNYREDVGWVVEGVGMKPDIEVENDPNLWARGIDAQLDRAIKEMMDRIAAKPIKRPVQPPDPVKTGG